MAEDDAPKSAYEIILARLKQKDRDEGVQEQRLSDAQKARIAELRSIYEAKLAEREILHRSALAKAGHDPEAVEKLEEEYRRDRERVTSERARKIEEARRA